jgi:hypothetical protein
MVPQRKKLPERRETTTSLVSRVASSFGFSTFAVSRAVLAVLLAERFVTDSTLLEMMLTPV